MIGGAKAWRNCEIELWIDIFNKNDAGDPDGDLTIITESEIQKDDSDEVLPIRDLVVISNTPKWDPLTVTNEDPVEGIGVFEIELTVCVRKENRIAPTPTILSTETKTTCVPNAPDGILHDKLLSENHVDISQEVNPARARSEKSWTANPAPYAENTTAPVVGKSKEESAETLGDWNETENEPSPIICETVANIATWPPAPLGDLHIRLESDIQNVASQEDCPIFANTELSATPNPAPNRVNSSDPVESSLSRELDVIVALSYENLIERPAVLEWIDIPIFRRWPTPDDTLQWVDESEIQKESMHAVDPTRAETELSNTPKEAPKSVAIWDPVEDTA
jgi:hypothetical protein